MQTNIQNHKLFGAILISIENPMTGHRIKRFSAIALLMSIFLTGCVSTPASPPISRQPVPGQEGPATQEPTIQEPVPERRAQPVTKPIEIDRERPSGAAVQVLAQADSFARQKQYDQALLLLDRAQRMSPQAGEVYLQMAKVKYDLGEYNKAEQLCLKAVALSGTDSRFRKKSLQTLAIVRDGKGDRAGAATAREQAAAL